MAEEDFANTDIDSEPPLKKEMTSTSLTGSTLNAIGPRQSTNSSILRKGSSAKKLGTKIENNFSGWSDEHDQENIEPVDQKEASILKLEEDQEDQDDYFRMESNEPVVPTTPLLVQPKPLIRDLEQEDRDDKAELERQLTETEECLLQTFQVFFSKESTMIMEALAESREDMKTTIPELVRSQEKAKDEIEKMSDGKYFGQRQPENSIPLAEYIRKKRNLNSAYQSSKTPEHSRRTNENNSYLDEEEETPSDKLAVEKYLKKRERHKQAEAHRQDMATNVLAVEDETKAILDKLKGADDQAKKERERQMEALRARLSARGQSRNANSVAKDHADIAAEILEKAKDSENAFEREKQSQKQKFQDRLSASRSRRAHTPTGREIAENFDPDDNNEGSNTNFSNVDIIWFG